MATYDSLITRSDASPLIPEDVVPEIFAGAREQSTVLRLARKLPNMARGQQRMAVLNSLPTAYIVGAETDLRQTSEVDWTNKYIYAEEVAVICPIPRNVVDDSDYPIWEQVMPLLGEAVGKVVDGAILIGTGAPSSWPTNIKAAAVAAGHTTAASAFSGSGDQQYYDAILSSTGLFAELEEQGFMVTGSIAHPVMRGRLRGVKDDNGMPIFNANMQEASRYQLDGTPMEFQRNGAFTSSDALMFSGDWNQVVWSFRADAQFEIAKEGVIQDGSGAIIYNLLQQRMFALVMWLRLGWQVPNPPKAMSPTASTRYPIAVLTAS